MKNEIRDLKSEDFLERCDAVEYLSQFINDEKISKNIQELFYDKNYLVRCEAYDAFCTSDSITIAGILLNRLQTERSQIARMHICSTINCIIKKHNLPDDMRNKITNLYFKEKSTRVLIAYCGTMYLLNGDIEYIKKALVFLNDDDYHIRCNVINALFNVTDDNNREVIFDAYRKRLVSERTIAVKSLLINALHIAQGE